MADVQHDFADWAKRKADPSAAQDDQATMSDDGDMEGGEGGEEEVAPAPELVHHAILEIGEAITALNQAKEQLEEKDQLDTCIASLTSVSEELTAAAEEMVGDEDDGDGDELDDGDQEIEPEGALE